jgi:ATP-dependent DNA ligase
MPSCGIQYVEHTEGDGVEMFKAVCKLGFEGIVSKKVDAPYKSEPSKAWLKIKNPKAPQRHALWMGRSRLFRPRVPASAVPVGDR